MARRKSEQLWYHGDTSLRTTFSDQRWERDATQTKNQNGPGIYWTNALSEAQGYGPYVYVATLPEGFRLVPQKPPSVAALGCLYEHASAEDREVFMTNWGHERVPARVTREVIDALSNYAHYPRMYDALVTLYGDLIRSPGEWVHTMQRCGYDGVVLDIEPDLGGGARQHLIVWGIHKLTVGILPR